jgi:hypothetical protein
MSPIDRHGDYYAGDTVRADAAVASAARTASGNGSSFNTETADSFEGFLTVTAASGTTPTLDVRLETSLDAGTTWSTVGAFAQATAATTKNKVFGPLGDLCRWAWTIGGTTPSFTFTVAAEANT